MAPDTQIIPLPEGNEVAKAIYAAYARDEEPDRPHLGGSEIGAECARRAWYSFRWAFDRKFGNGTPEDRGRMLRLFQRGHREEAFFNADLRKLGLEVYETDPRVGKQWRFIACGGHFGCSLDGVIKQLGKHEWLLLECKTHNSKSFTELQLLGVRTSKPQHWFQVQTYMHLSGLRVALYLSVNKDTDQLYSEIVHYDPEAGARMLRRAEQVIFADEPPEKLSEDPAYFKCKLCPAYSICHGNAVPRVNARTCAHSTPMPDGTWHCERCNKTLTLDEQRDGAGLCCGENHVYIPALIAHRYEYLGGTDDGAAARLRDKLTGVELVNGPPPHVTSEELRVLAAGAYDANVQAIREAFDARVVDATPAPGEVPLDGNQIVAMKDFFDRWQANPLKQKAAPAARTKRGGMTDAQRKCLAGDA